MDLATSDAKLWDRVSLLEDQLARANAEVAGHRARVEACEERCVELQAGCVEVRQEVARAAVAGERRCREAMLQVASDLCSGLDERRRLMRAQLQATLGSRF